MILRESDWRHYPRAIVHDTSRNKSFLDFAVLLKALKVKHYYLVLALHDPDLKDVDPFDRTLSQTMKTKIIQECSVNPWYFFRECVRVPADGSSGSPFRINRGTFAMYWSFFNNIESAVEFLRQHGKTIGMCALELWLLRFLKRSRTIHVTKGPKLREETIDTLKALRDNLPSYLWPHHKDDPDNKEAFACSTRKNKLITAIGQNDEMSANGTGRGLTAGRLFCDEGPFTKNIHHILPAAFGSGTAARRINEEEGVPYGNVIATTPGDLDTDEGAYVHGLMTAGIPWDERYIDMPTRDDLITLIEKGATSEQPRISFYIKFNHRQLGTTDRELYQMISNASGTPEKIKKDYGGEWASGGLGKPYSAEDAERMKNSRRKAVHKEIAGPGYIIDWFYDEHSIASKLASVRHVIGIDSSEQIGRDATALVLTNSETGEVAAVCKVKESNVTRYILWLVEFMMKYQNTVLIIERKSTGGTILDGLFEYMSHKSRDLHQRIYVSILQEMPQESELFKNFRRGCHGSPARWWDDYRKYAGFKTDKTKREKLYTEVFSNSLKLCADLLNSETLIDEVLALVERKGRIDHVKSGHDDTVIAWLLTMYLILFGKHLNHYHISNQRLMVRQRLNSTTGGVDEELLMRKEEEQRQILAALKETRELLNSTKCPVTKLRAKSELQVLMSKVDTSYDSANTMQALRELAQRERLT